MVEHIHPVVKAKRLYKASETILKPIRVRVD